MRETAISLYENVRMTVVSHSKRAWFP